MKKLFLISLLSLSCSADISNDSQLCQLFQKAGAKNPNDMTSVAIISGAVKKEKKEKIQALIKKTFEEYKKTNSNGSLACEQIERALSKAGMLSFQSKLPPDPVVRSEPTKLLPEKKIIAQPKTSTTQPKTIANALKAVPKADSYKIYNILKTNDYLSKEGKKDNRRKEIIEIINKSLSGKTGLLDPKEINQIEKNLQENKFLK